MECVHNSLRFSAQLGQARLTSTTLFDTITQFLANKHNSVFGLNNGNYSQLSIVLAVVHALCQIVAHCAHQICLVALEKQICD